MTYRVTSESTATQRESKRMIADDERIHIALAYAHEHNWFLDQTKKTGRFGKWNLPPGAEVGDLAVVYLQQKISCFVGTFVVDSEAEGPPEDADEFLDEPWYWGRDAELLPYGYVERNDLIAKYEDMWPLLRRVQTITLPHENTSVERLEQFLTDLSLNDVAVQDAGVLETLDREEKHSLAPLNRTFRDAAIRASRGICACCRVNYFKVLDGMGRRCLQVHHRKQRARQEENVITRHGDLAIVCANCHSLIHIDPMNAIEVEVLRDMIANSKLASSSSPSPPSSL